MLYEINPHGFRHESLNLQAFQVRRGDDQIRTGVLAHRADCPTNNRDDRALTERRGMGIGVPSVRFRPLGVVTTTPRSVSARRTPTPDGRAPRNQYEALHPSFDAKAHSHWPVHQRPTSASRKAA